MSRLFVFGVVCMLVLVVIAGMFLADYCLVYDHDRDSIVLCRNAYARRGGYGAYGYKVYGLYLTRDGEWRTARSLTCYGASSQCVGF